MNPAPEPPVEPVSAAADEALVALRRIVKTVDSHARALAQQSGLTPSQLVVLKDLAGKNGAKPSELARTTGLKQATISILLDRLQERRLVQRARGDADRRTVMVQITPEGRQTLADAPDLLQVQFGARFNQLPEWEQAYINAALKRLVALMGVSDLDAAPVLDIGGVTDLPAPHTHRS